MLLFHIYYFENTYVHPSIKAILSTWSRISRLFFGKLFTTRSNDSEYNNRNAHCKKKESWKPLLIVTNRFRTQPERNTLKVFHFWHQFCLIKCFIWSSSTWIMIWITRVYFVSSCCACCTLDNNNNKKKEKEKNKTKTYSEKSQENDYFSVVCLCVVTRVPASRPIVYYAIVCCCLVFVQSACKPHIFGQTKPHIQQDLSDWITQTKTDWKKRWCA